MKTTKFIAISAALAAAAVSVPAFAQSKSTVAGPWFIGGDVGWAHASDTTISGNTTGVVAPFTVSGFDSNKTSFGVFGGYQFDPNWGVELQYTDLGSRGANVAVGAPISATGRIGNAKTYQWGVALTGTLPLQSDFFLRGKLGVSSNHVDSTNGTVTNGAGTATFTSSGSSKTDVLAGAGVGYQFTPNVSARLEYEYFGKFDVGNGNTLKGSNVGLRVQFNF